MPTATLTVELPESVWIGNVSRCYPDARVRVLAAIADRREGVLIAEIRTATVDEFVSDVRAATDVTSVTVLDRTESEVFTRIETTSAILLDYAQQSGVPIEMPFTITDGEATLELTVPYDQLSALSEKFTAGGLSFTVESISSDIDRESLLTDAQWRVLTAAVRAGYYDTPRTCTLTELANELDLAKSTCSETLHRTEERIVKWFLNANIGGHSKGEIEESHTGDTGITIQEDLTNESDDID